MGLLKILKGLWQDAEVASDIAKAANISEGMNINLGVVPDFDGAEYEKALIRHATKVKAITASGLIEGNSSDIMTPAETLFLWYIKDKPAKDPNIATYWTTIYCIDDFQAAITRLCANGLLSVEEDYAFNASKCTIPELKVIAKEHEISLAGKKAELLERILNTLSKTEVSKYFGGIYFRLTDKGKVLLENSKPLILFHQHRSSLDGDLTLEKVAKLQEKSPDIDEYQLFINYYKKRAISEAKKGECPPRSLVYCLSSLFALKQDIVSSLKCLLIICYWDMSGAMDLPYTFDGKSLFGDENSPTNRADKVKARIEFAPAAVSSISEYKSSLNLDDDALHNIYSSVLLNIETVDAVYSKDEIFALLLTALEQF